ncbi:hypothetical protein NM045_0456 [Neisseria meningitidis NM045]|nr:hypothetical protein NM045_0456 [Neisseria meningitidis NM045]
MNASQKPWLSIIALAIDGIYSGLTKTSTALPRLSSKRTIL